MYTFTHASKQDFDDIIALLFQTGYYEYATEDNKLNLPACAFFNLQILQPYLKHIYVVEENKNFVGFYFATTQQQMKAIEERQL